MPQGLTDLCRCLTDAYGTDLAAVQIMTSLPAPLPVFTGDWTPARYRAAQRDVHARLAAGFVNLTWLDAALLAG
ncbi:hypothetical protein LAJ19_20400 (plasmid) [Deinococcus taeanensis]|uniref:hypothetical protein n=1 Tax=Deinococcus taeanensis TaxID=2737050 RepID=UPI001CDBE571|nr:hypothetical protein [Deinococcus taeanensis]UBV45175.1 hypothetical protein LAJ19_20400 [Deinococcus taeanensis]